MAFKSNDRTFEKIYGAFDKRDYFNSQGLAKVQIGNFERALQKNDKGAQQILDKFKGDMGKAKDYITQVITDRKKEQAFNDDKAVKVGADSIQKGKPQYGAVDLVKSRIHNSSQKYTIALYSALRNKKFTKWKDVHNDVDSLIGESVNEIDTKKANLLRTNMPGYVGPKFAKKASDEDILAMADLKDQKARIYNRYVKVVDDAIAKLQKKYRIKESVNESASKEAMGIAALTGTRGSAVQDFIDKNRINSRKLFNALKKANLQGRINFASALAGKPNNPNARLTKKLFGEDKGEVLTLRKKAKSEKAFYDVLDNVEKKYGKRSFELWLDKSLKDFKLNPKKYRTSAEKQEALYQAKL